MRLSDLFPKESVLRDAEFDALGLSNTVLDMRLLSFLEDPRFAAELNANKNICAVICPADTVDSLDEHISGVVLSDNPRKDYFELHNHLSQTKEYWPDLEPTRIGQDCKISPLAVIDDYGVVIGDNVTVEEFVVIRGPSRIGNNCTLHAGAKIGGAGYEFKIFGDSVLDVAHCGNVHIGDNVIIWENATIHRAVYPWDTTVVGECSRVSAQSHIDHGAKVGPYTKICAGVVVSGRTDIGEHAYIGPGSVISNRIVIGKGAKTSLGSVVTQDVPEKQTVSGNFAIEHRRLIDFIKSIR